MGVVGYRCPTSGEDVTTAIQTNKDTLVRMHALELTIWVWCPHCLAGHKIKPEDARIGGEPIEESLETMFDRPSFATG
jgi:hypothetical protein